MTQVASSGHSLCEHPSSVIGDKDMKRSRSRFTLIEAAALLAVMAIIVIAATPKFSARGLSASICSFPDSRRDAECLGAGKDRRIAQPVTRLFASSVRHCRKKCPPDPANSLRPRPGSVIPLSGFTTRFSGR